MKRLFHFLTFDELKHFHARRKIKNFDVVENWYRKFHETPTLKHGYVAMNDTTTGEILGAHYLISQRGPDKCVSFGVDYSWPIYVYEKLLNRINSETDTSDLKKATFYCAVDKFPLDLKPADIVYTNDLTKVDSKQKPTTTLNVADYPMCTTHLEDTLDTIGKEFALVILTYGQSLDFEYEMLLSRKGYHAIRCAFQFGLY